MRSRTAVGRWRPVESTYPRSIRAAFVSATGPRRRPHRPAQVQGYSWKVDSRWRTSSGMRSLNGRPEPAVDKKVRAAGISGHRWISVRVCRFQRAGGSQQPREHSCRSPVNQTANAEVSLTGCRKRPSGGRAIARRGHGAQTPGSSGRHLTCPAWTSRLSPRRLVEGTSLPRPAVITTPRPADTWKAVVPND